MRDGAVVVGPLDVQAKGGAVRGEAQLALEAGVRLHLLFEGHSARSHLLQPLSGRTF